MWLDRRLFITLFTSLCFAPCTLIAQQHVNQNFTGKVVGVSDGDTIRVLNGRREQKVRLFGIDCPESAQAFGTQAKKTTSRLAFAQIVEVRSHGYDQYGRTVAEVFLPDKRNLNHELVRQGMCWHYHNYAPNDKKLTELQRAAEGARIGLWRDPHPVKPWEYRREKGIGGRMNPETSWKHP